MGDQEGISKLFSSSMGMVVGFAISGFISVLTRIVLGRILQPEKYGMLSEGLAILNFFVILSLFGTGTAISRFKSYGDDFYNSFSTGIVVTTPLSIISAAVVYLSAGTISNLLGNPGLEPVFKIFAFNIPALVLLSVLIGFFRGEKKTFERVLLSDFLVPIVILIISSLLVILLAPTPENAAIGYVTSGWIGVIVGSILILKNKTEFRSPNFSEIRNLLEFSGPLMIASLFSFGVTWANILILGYLIGSESAGFYNAAYPLTYSIGVLLSSVTYLFLPVASTVYAKRDFNQLKNIYHTATRWLMVAALPLSAVLAFRPEFIITFLYGESYSTAASLLFILVIGRITNVSFGPLGQLLTALGETRNEAISRGLGLTILLSLSLTLIPRIGIIGAGLAYLAGMFVTNITRLLFARKYIGFNPFNRDLLKPLTAFLLPLPILLWPISSTLINLISIGSYGVLYLGILLLSKPFQAEDLKAAEDFISRLPVLKGYKDKILSEMERFRE